jgi:tetratricopeptide (TPR) repeat protein
MQLIAFAAKDWKRGLSAGEELVKIDTAASDSSFFRRQSLAYAADSQPQKAAETAARGVAKFANNAELLQIYVQALIQAGQTQQAVAALRKSIAVNPKAPGAYLSLSQLQATLNQPDSALVSLQTALANGDSAATVARYATSLGQTAYKAAAASKDTADFRRAITFLEFANKTAATPEGQYLLGVSSFTLAGTYLTTAQAQSKEKGQQAAACRSSKTAQELLGTAQINLPAGGKVDPANAGKLLTSLPQYSGYADQFVKALCK